MFEGATRLLSAFDFGDDFAGAALPARDLVFGTWHRRKMSGGKYHERATVADANSVFRLARSASFVQMWAPK
jgi:hypothetical protein